MRSLLLFAVAFTSCRVAPPTTPSSKGLRFCLHEGEGHNCLLRDDRVAAHLHARSGTRARILVAFPAENSGIALWAEAPGRARVALRLDEPVESFTRDGLHGVRFGLTSSAPLRVERILLASMRLIRDFEQSRALAYRDRVLEAWARRFPALPAPLQAELARAGARPASLRARLAPRIEHGGRALRASGVSLDGKHRFELSLALESGRVEGTPASPVLSAGGGPLRLRVEAASSYRPLRGLSLDELLRPEARAHLRGLEASPDPIHRRRMEALRPALRSLAFLASDRKLLAGSWRFLTYFGRDTLMSLLILRPALAPEAVEAGLQSVLDRLSPEGEVAHEESLGDQAVLERLERWAQLAAEGKHAELAAPGSLSAPVFDYKMVDDDFMLPLLVAAYLEDGAVGEARARAFLARRSAAGLSNLESIAANLRFVLTRAAPYAASGEIRDLIPLRDGLKVGDWRDSEEGLGLGRYAASVNAYLVPAALRAAQQLLRSERIDAAALAREVQRGHAELAGDLVARSGSLAARWEGARRHFRIRLSPVETQQRLDAFLRSGAPAEERNLLWGRMMRNAIWGPGRFDSSAAPVPTESTIFDALALNADGSPVEVMHSDDGFDLLARAISAEELDERLKKYERYYPVGLRSLHGIFVASPTLSRRTSDWRTFDRTRYHGTVVWSWHLALLQRGLLRQLEHHREFPKRDKLCGRIRFLLHELQHAERRVGPLLASELWTVRVARSRLGLGVHEDFEAAAFGGGAHADESNALQLWSSLGLAVDLERTRLGLLRVAR